MSCSQQSMECETKLIYLNITKIQYYHDYFFPILLFLLKKAQEKITFFRQRNPFEHQKPNSGFHCFLSSNSLCYNIHVLGCDFAVLQHCRKVYFFATFAERGSPTVCGLVHQK